MLSLSSLTDIPRVDKVWHQENKPTKPRRGSAMKTSINHSGLGNTTVSETCCNIKHVSRPETEVSVSHTLLGQNQDEKDKAGGVVNREALGTSWGGEARGPDTANQTSQIVEVLRHGCLV